VPPALDRVIQRGMSKAPEQRYEHLSALVADVRRAYGLNTASGASAADTVAALPGMPSRTSLPPQSEKRSLPLWPFGVALAFGVFAVVQLAPRAPALVDATADPAQPTLDDKNTVTTPPVPKTALTSDAALLDDAGAFAAPDAAAAPDDPSKLSAFEREERAKDALERAQRALDAGNKDQAREALDEAFRYDPEHPDIAALRRKL
jgi:hypothetical protein